MNLEDVLLDMDAFRDTPIDDNECIEEPFMQWEVGTHREYIWAYYEDACCDFSIAKYLMGE